MAADCRLPGHFKVKQGQTIYINEIALQHHNMIWIIKPGKSVWHFSDSTILLLAHLKFV